MAAVLVTGASGFVGRHLCRSLLEDGHEVRAAVRDPASAPPGVAVVAVGEIGAGTDWAAAVDGVETVVHLAARVHVTSDAAADPLAEFRRVNVAGTEVLARAAAAAGVRRLVLLSSIKVNGEATTTTPFREDDPPAPQDPYGVSKLEAERRLRAVAGETGLEATIVRPPLVYGPGVKANFLRLLRLVDRGLPLPLAAIDNRRSLVGVRNLCDLIGRCAVDPRAAGEVFLAGDGADVSTPDLIRRIAAALGRPARLFAVPPALLVGLGRLTGRGAAVERLRGSLQVDIAKARRVLDWTPPVTLDDELAATAAAYRGALGT